MTLYGQRVEALTPAVLATAFHGELVLTEAELARREGREFEPAGVLLERVRVKQEQMVIEYVKHKGRITRSDVAELCQISLYQASRLLGSIRTRHPEFQSRGVGRGTYYIWEA